LTQHEKAGYTTHQYTLSHAHIHMHHYTLIQKEIKDPKKSYHTQIMEKRKRKRKRKKKKKRKKRR